MQVVYDSHGKHVGGKFSNPDINSPTVRKEFDEQMNFWLNEWLPKQKEIAATPDGVKPPEKDPSEKTAPAAKESSPGTPPTKTLTPKP
jgi:hypothetical protein